MQDPNVQRIMNSIAGNASLATHGMGIQGGMATQTAQRAMADAATQMWMQRKQLGLQALGMAQGDVRQIMGLRDQAARMQAEDQWANQLAQYESQRGVGQMVGGTIGAIGGGLLGSAGGLEGIAAGARAGWGIGGGIGGGMMGGPPAKPVYQSPYYGGYGGGGMAGSGRGGY